MSPYWFLLSPVGLRACTLAFSSAQPFSDKIKREKCDAAALCYKSAPSFERIKIDEL